MLSGMSGTSFAFNFESGRTRNVYSFHHSPGCLTSRACIMKKATSPSEVIYAFQKRLGLFCLLFCIRGARIYDCWFLEK